MQNAILRWLGWAILCLACDPHASAQAPGPSAPADNRLVIPLATGERVWHGLVRQGEQLPCAPGTRLNLHGDNRGNQSQPLLLGNLGLWVWSEEPFAFEVTATHVIVTRAPGAVQHGRAGTTLAEARRFAGGRFFPPAGRLPDELLFAQPQWNTWIELTYNQNQADILRYARGIVEHGFAPGVLMIDDTWQEDYGLWQFHPGRFPDPRAMMNELHRLGFKVMLWVCPFVSPDQAGLMRQLQREKCLLLKRATPDTTWANASDPAIIKWWNGYSALLDFSHPAASRWFNGELDRLVRDYGVDGFKLDAGDMPFYPPDALSHGNVTPNRQCELYAQVGLRFPLNEYRACWKMGGQPLAQRLHDKSHQWDDVRRLVPQMLTAGLTGHPFSCPDLIGGGDYVSFLDLKQVDQDLIVRSAQIHALMPMMQFSVAPWRVLDAEHLAAVKAAVQIRTQFTPLILELARAAARNGEPIVRSLEYVFPGHGYAEVRDQFLLGDRLLVAPLDKPGRSRTVIFPPGQWRGDDGRVQAGGTTNHIEVPLNRLPHFERLDGR